MYNKTERATERLIKDFKTHNKLIIAVDFDNTIYDFHNIGIDSEVVCRLVRRALMLGHEVYIFSANTDHDLIRKECVRLGLGELKINESSLDHLFDCRKPFYSILLDDRAGLESAMASLNLTLDYQESLLTRQVS